MVGALHSVVARLLDDRSCFVAFSGGCDSSLVLAAAADACRASGHPDPIPVTYRYAQAPDADEREHQELLVRYLQLRDWLIIDLDEDGDLLGAPATCALRAWGLVWPPAGLAHIAALQQLGHGLLLTGEGGDELLGSRRISAIAAVTQRVRHRHIPSRALGRVALEAVAPRRARESMLLRQLERDYEAHWLATDLRRELLRRIARLDAKEPLDTRAYMEYVGGLPSVRIGHHNLRAISAQYGLRWEAPLFDPSFLGALAGLPWHAYRGRTEILRRHFCDLLPPEIIERRTKAVFNRAYLGDSTREFARRWNGRGLPEGVDADWLKDHWCTADEIHAGTVLLLHQAWLETEGATGSAAGRVPPTDVAACDRASQ